MGAVTDFEKIRISSELPIASRTRCPELLTLHKPGNAAHLVQFYDDDASIIDNVSYLAAKALSAGESSVLIVTAEHRAAIERRLEKFGLDLDRFRESGRYVSLDAAQTLAQFSIAGAPDETKFNQVVGDIIRRATESSMNSFVFAFGEMVGLLCADNRADDAVRLEQFWNSLSRRHRFSLYCAYSLDSFGTAPDIDAVVRICTEHSLTVAAEILG